MGWQHLRRNTSVQNKDHAIAMIIQRNTCVRSSRTALMQTHTQFRRRTVPQTNIPTQAQTHCHKETFKPKQILPFLFRQLMSSCLFEMKMYDPIPHTRFPHGTCDLIFGCLHTPAIKTSTHVERESFIDQETLSCPRSKVPILKTHLERCPSY